MDSKLEVLDGKIDVARLRAQTCLQIVDRIAARHFFV
jgi:hypothetical protein